jgi:HK97 family phage major capsid protein
MSEFADKIMERRAALIAQAQEIATAGVTEGRDLSADEEARFDGMLAEAGKLQKRASDIAASDQAARDIEESFRSLTKDGSDPREQRGNNGQGEFGKWARESRSGESHTVELRDMSGTGGLGPKGVASQLWEYMVASSQLLQAGVEVINTADGNTLPLPRVTAHAETPDATVAANGPISESDSTVSTVNLSVSKYAFITQVPYELINDATFDVEGYIARNAGRQLGLRVAKQASIAGVAGFTTAGATGANTATASSLGTQSTAGQGSDYLIDLYHSVLPEYRAMSSAWLMADPTAAIVRKLKASTGEPVWQPALTAGDPDMILGKPVYVDPYLPSPAPSVKSIYFGDWSALKVRIAGGLRFERSNEFAFANDQVTFRAVVRTGAVVIDPNAVKHFLHGTA